MTVYYNEFDEPTAWWLKGLSDNGVIPKGFVATRSIVDVDPDELKQYTQCHFFAGIGGWAYALMFEPGDFPLVNGVPNRVLKYRGYGNAIVPQVGALFTRALLGI